MKKTKLILTTLGFLLTVSFTFVQCSKDADSELDESTIDAVTASATVTDVASNDIVNNVYEGSTLIENANSTFRTVDSSVANKIVITEDNGVIITIEKTNGSYPITITKDFTKLTQADTDDGFKRSGIIKTVYTGKVKGKNSVVGATATTTFINYKLDSVFVTGTSILTNTSTDTLKPSFTVTETNLVVTLADGEILTRNGVLTTTMTAGASTQSRLDDVFETTGEITISNSKGLSWTTTIALNNPLKRLGKCKKGLKLHSGSTTTVVSNKATSSSKVTSGTSTDVVYGEKSSSNLCDTNTPKLKCTIKGKNIDKTKPSKGGNFGG